MLRDFAEGFPSRWACVLVCARPCLTGQCGLDEVEPLEQWMNLYPCCVTNSLENKIAGLKSSEGFSSAELTLVAPCLLAPTEVWWVKSVSGHKATVGEIFPCFTEKSLLNLILEWLRLD